MSVHETGNIRVGNVKGGGFSPVKKSFPCVYISAIVSERGGNSRRLFLLKVDDLTLEVKTVKLAAIGNTLSEDLLLIE